MDDLPRISHDWYGVPAPIDARWSLAMAGTDLCLRGVVRGAAPRLTPQDEPGAFVEGLWEGDVVEAFLLNPATGFYLELNLSPSGAWWACAHTAPRVRATPGPRKLDGVRTQSLGTPDPWDSTLRIPLASLPPDLAFHPATTRANVTFCLGHPPQYFSAVPLGGGTPDFHRPETWKPMTDLMGYGSGQK